MLNAALMSDKTKPLTAAEKAEAKKLKARFVACKKEKGLTQERPGELLGTTQGMISHWLNGRARISDLTLIRFAHHLDFDADEIRPGVLARIPRVRAPTDLSDRATRIAREVDTLTEADQELVASVIQRIRDAERR